MPPLVPINSSTTTTFRVRFDATKCPQLRRNPPFNKKCRGACKPGSVMKRGILRPAPHRQPFL